MDELERLVRTGMYLAATRRFEELLMSGELGVRELAMGYHIISVAHYRLGALFAARKCGERASELAEEIGEHRLLLKVWKNMVEYLNVIGDTVEALRHGQLWLENAGKWEPSMLSDAGKVHYNLAQVYHARRDHVQELWHYDRAIDLLREHGHRNHLIMALHNAAWTRYEVGLQDQADSQVTQARLLFDEDTSSTELVKEQVLLRAYRDFWAGEYREVMVACEELMADPNATELQRFWAVWMIGSSAVRLFPTVSGTFTSSLREAAVTMSLLAVDLSLKLQRADLMNRASRLKAEAAGITGQTNQAG